ncbi:MAG: endopeptidase La [Lysobacterales bacterium]
MSASHSEELLSAVPLLPLRDVVVFPHMVVPLFVGRERSIQSLDAAMAGDKQVLLLAQKSPDTDDPEAGDLHTMGTLANVLQLVKLPDGTIKVLVEGVSRARLVAVELREGVGFARVQPVESENQRDEREVLAATKSLLGLFENFIKLNRKVPPELMTTLAGISEPGRLADTIAAHLGVRLQDKQEVLETLDVFSRLERLIGLVNAEVDLQQIEKRIRGRVKSQMEKSQREYYLNEQMKAIQKELGDLDEAPNEMDELARKIAKAGMPQAVEAKARAEQHKLKQMPPMSAEATVVRNYLDWLLSVPWKKRSKIRQDLAAAQAVLDADHYGLEKVKERIVEYLAVQQRVKKMKGPILCLVGPPGVGKTSLGQSIARATNRKFVRIALGGVRDEAEVRGHRRTYVGSMPGRVIQNLAKVGVRNPLVVLDEIDKMSVDFRGDPSSALLEVLDPEQNHTFNDHYLEVDFDLSEVMFIATANSLDIPAALLDRMEVIRLPGYTEDEKIHIAERYLMPKEMKAAGLVDGELDIGADAIRDMIRFYTREAGVRNLGREIAKISRKVVKQSTLQAAARKQKGARKLKTKLVKVGSGQLADFLGVRRFNFGLAEVEPEIGRVTGLAWTQVGGDLLDIEAAVVPGKGKLIHTGKLGEVMKESIQTALSVVRSRAVQLGIDPDFNHKWDIHIHVPEGATPKDGPSAGIGMCTALVSVLARNPVRADVAMTGEITLRGKVLPIGGLKEKLLAAHRGGLRTVIIPDENAKDLVDIPESITSSLEIKTVKWIDEVLVLALAEPLLPVPAVMAEIAPAIQSTGAEESAAEVGGPRRH